MKKILTLALAAAMVATSAVVVSANPANSHTITAAYGTPVVDGQMDEIWNNAEMQVQDSFRSGTETDAKAQIRTMYDDNYFYVLAYVPDNTLWTSDLNLAEYTYDTVECCVSLTNSEATSYDGVFDWWVGVTPYGVRNTGSNCTPLIGGGTDVNDAEYLTLHTSLENDPENDTAAGYYVEYAFNVKAIDEELVMDAGTTIGMEVSVNDNAEYNGRTMCMGWADTTDGASGNPSTFGNVVFGAKDGAAAPAAEAAPAAPVAAAPAVGELQNLALGAKVEVSGLETEGTNTGDMAVDGDLTTRWSSETDDEAYITLDLGTPIPVGYLEIYWETACAADYIVETSSNGTEWTTVATVTGNTVGASPAGDAVIHEFTPATARFVRIATSKRNTEWGNSIWEIVARASKDAVVTETAGAYPSSANEVPDGSVIINGARIGIETGWGDNAATGRDAAFDGDTATFFDPLGTGDGYCGVDAGEEMILTKILIHPRDGQLPRFNGATIEGANEEDFSDAVALYISVEEASEFAWIDVSDEIETADNTGYRYFRYINYTNHGDVAEVELYGYAVDGTNPGVVEAAPVEEPAPVEEVVEAPVEEAAPAEEVVEAPVEEAAPVEEVVEAPAEEVVVEEPVEEAPQTFDFGVIAAVAALISAAGYAISKKR